MGKIDLVEQLEQFITFSCEVPRNKEATVVGMLKMIPISRPAGRIVVTYRPHGTSDLENVIDGAGGKRKAEAREDTV